VGALRSITLTQLEAQLIRVSVTCVKTQDVDTLAEAQGVQFLCPVCYLAQSKDSRIGVHSVRVWFRDRGVSEREYPSPGRWHVEGTGLHDLTLHASVQLLSGCKWHGFIKNGEVSVL
jgi:hypothetical protein